MAMLSEVVDKRAPFPRLLVSDRINNAVALGISRPTIVLPSETQTDVSGLKSVLAHEWAHIRHGDLGLLALGRCLLVVLFAHPIYWWLRRLIRDNREALADAAATTHINRKDYADELLRWARTHVEHRAARISTALGLWDLETGKELVTVQGLPGADSKVWSRGSLTFSPDSLILASGITRQQLVCDCVG
jgi:hypothetical protein